MSPLQPPPGFEQVFAAACPGCGVAIQDHSSPQEHQDHLTGWLSDPDRTVDEVLEFAAGTLAGIQHMFHIGLPVWAVEQVAGQHVDQLLEVLRRRRSA